MWSDRLRCVPWDFVAIAILAAVLRLLFLDLKAPHFDEGINGWFADQMRVDGTFKYRADNFHGPWHFYTVFLSQSLLGRNVWALRLPVVAASLLCIPVILLFARWLGRSAVRWAAAAFAVSPAFVFYGRYSIHEPWFVLFTMLFTWGTIALWLDRDRAGLWAACLGLTGMILNKETYIIHAGALALAGLVFAAWGKFSPVRPPVTRAARRGWSSRDAWTAAAVCFFAIVFFYSGNFFYWPGLLGPFQAVLEWTKTGAAGNGHEKAAYDLLPFVNYYWLALLVRYEWPALAGLFWSVRYAWPAPAVPRLLAILGAGVLLAYSLVPYKTPWCIISILWPWLLLFGVWLSSFKRTVFAAVIGAALLAASLAIAIRLNFREYENDAEPYVYVQTYRSVETLTGPLLALAQNDPQRALMAGSVYLESYYPLPWILGDFPNVGYFPDGKIPEPLPEADFHVVETERAGAVRDKLGSEFTERTLRFRSGVKECSVFFSRDIVEALGQIGKTQEPRRREP